MEINTSRGGINLFAGASKADYRDYTRSANEEGDAFSLQVLGIEIQRYGKTFTSKFVDFGRYSHKMMNMKKLWSVSTSIR